MGVAVLSSPRFKPRSTQLQMAILSKYGVGVMFEDADEEATSFNTFKGDGHSLSIEICLSLNEG
jgi:hypothetical protein